MFSFVCDLGFRSWRNHSTVYRIFVNNKNNINKININKRGSFWCCFWLEWKWDREEWRVVGVREPERHPRVGGEAERRRVGVRAPLGRPSERRDGHRVDRRHTDGLCVRRSHSQSVVADELAAGAHAHRPHRHGHRAQIPRQPHARHRLARQDHSHLELVQRRMHAHHYAPFPQPFRQVKLHSLLLHLNI